MRQVGSGVFKLLLAGVAVVVLGWSAHHMLFSPRQQNDNTRETSSAEKGSQATASRPSDTTQSNVPGIRDNATVSQDGNRGKAPWGAGAGGRAEGVNMASGMGSGADEFVIAPSEDGEPGLTEGDIKSLHEQQRAETWVEFELGDLVVPHPEGGEPAMTGWDVTALHEQQLGEMKTGSELDEPAILPSEDGEPGMTVRDTLALHEQQLAEMRAGPGLDEWVIAPSESGDPGMTLREIETLHEEQRSGVNASAQMDEVAILPSDDGEPGMRLRDILALHEKQRAEDKSEF